MNSEAKCKKIYQIVIDYIGDMIINEDLKKGDKLPTERDLAMKLNVSRNSIREALKILDVIGLVSRRQGDGTYIKESFDDCFIEPLSIMFMLDRINENEILELRNMIEAETASLAAMRITDKEIKNLTEVYEALVKEEDESISAKYDKEFHYIIARASKNKIIFNYYNVMSMLMDSFIKEIREEALKELKLEEINNLHKDIYFAITNKEPKAASQAMRAHMSVINSYYPYIRSRK